MIKHGAFIAFIALLLTGCYDQFYGPSIRNAASEDMTISVTYSDGSVSKNVWQPCAEAFIGKSDRASDVVQGVAIEMDGKIIHRLNAEQVRDLLEKEKSAGGYSVWSVDEKSIRLETSPESGGCSRGKKTN